MGRNIFFAMTLFAIALLLSPDKGWANPYKEISAPVVKNMLEKENVLVINVLSRVEYDLHHITGSINIPLNKLKTSDKLPADLSTSLIFHCMGFR
ncbi:MAG: rhodanese-like domain-containing protein [Thermodesulfobacteriota bacterium]